MPRCASSQPAPTKVSARWRKLLGALPGYDPFAQAQDCWFDPKDAQLALNFFPDCLRHVEGRLAGKPFVLERWQQAIVANLFGWMTRNEYGEAVRRFREVFVMCARKNGKTPLAAGLALLILFCDPEFGQQGFLAAGNRIQAGRVFRQCAGFVRQEPALKSLCRIYGGRQEAGQSRSIVREERNSFLRVIAADAAGEHGGNTSVAIVDETHVQPNRDLIDVLETSMASANRKHPLMVNITTAGHDRTSICYEKYVKACRVRDNGGDPDKPGYDPSFLPVIFEALPTDDWTSEKVWAKANPNLGVSVSLDYLRRKCQQAQEYPHFENVFKQLHLSLWTEQASRWLPMAKWELCGKAKVDPEALVGRKCFGGLDLASSNDLCAFVLAFPEEDGGYTLLPWFWVPEAAVTKRSRADGIRYDVWVKNGLLKATVGDWADYSVLHQDIKALNEKYHPQIVNYDPKEASMLAQMLLGDGVPMRTFTQSFALYNEPVKIFEQRVGELKIRHGAHPVLDWNAGNVALAENVAHLRLPSKNKSGEKIDGIVAALMAIAEAMKGSGPPSGTYYETHDLEFS